MEHHLEYVMICNGGFASFETELIADGKLQKSFLSVIIKLTFTSNYPIAVCPAA